MTGRLRVMEAGAALVVGFLVLAPLLAILWPAGADGPAGDVPSVCSASAADALDGKPKWAGKGKDKGDGPDGKEGKDGKDDEDDDGPDDDGRDGKGGKDDGKGREGPREAKGREDRPRAVPVAPAAGASVLEPAAPSVDGASC